MLADWATSESIHGALEYALSLYLKENLWTRVRRNAMEQDFSWKRSVKQYAKLYRRALKG